jgi:hypothetical protein
MSTATGKRKVQKIKLRLQGNPVKFDAVVTAMAGDGSWMDVEFDGPIENMRLYKYGGDRSPLFCNLCEEDRQQRAEQFVKKEPMKDIQLWEVC